MHIYIHTPGIFYKKHAIENVFKDMPNQMLKKWKKIVKNYFFKVKNEEAGSTGLFRDKESLKRNRQKFDFFSICITGSSY